MLKICHILEKVKSVPQDFTATYNCLFQQLPSCQCIILEPFTGLTISSLCPTQDLFQKNPLKIKLSYPDPQSLHEVKINTPLLIWLGKPSSCGFHLPPWPHFLSSAGPTKLLPIPECFILLSHFIHLHMVSPLPDLSPLQTTGPHPHTGLTPYRTYLYCN